jgi:hypothetical protein
MADQAAAKRLVRRALSLDAPASALTRFGEAAFSLRAPVVAGLPSRSSRSERRLVEPGETSNRWSPFAKASGDTPTPKSSSSGGATRSRRRRVVVCAVSSEPVSHALL